MSTRSDEAREAWERQDGTAVSKLQSGNAYIAALERDRDRILTEAVQELATRGFDAQYHGGYWTVEQHSQASLIPDGAAARLRGWLSGEGP